MPRRPNPRSKHWDPFGPYCKSTGCPETVVTLGPVPETREYIAASIERDKVRTELARIAPENPDDADNGRFILEWLISDESPEHVELRRQAQRRFDYYLIDLGKARPWSYLCYTCTTTSNLYSNVNGNVYFEWHNRVRPNS